MTRNTVAVVNEMGIHLRAAARIVGITARFPCRVWIGAGEVAVDGKSLLGITSLLARQGTQVTVSAEGQGEAEVVEKVSALICSGFAE